MLFFAALAIAYRLGHPEGSAGFGLDANGNMVAATLHYSLTGDNPAHPSAWSVVIPHGLSYTMVQATVAILLLVGFESVTSLGEEAKNPNRDIPRGVLLSLTIQGLFCYMIEYFAANYFMSSAYSLNAAKGSAAPIGDMMVIIGNVLLGGHGQAFMLLEAFTVFLALIGTTLSCINTGARVTYAMGRDEEVPEHFGMLHGDNLTPHRAIWVLATISAVLGAYAALYYFAGGSAPDDKTIATLPQNLWYAIGMSSNASLSSLPNGLLLVTLVSNFGTFMLYGLTNIVCIVAFREHRRVPRLQAHGGADLRSACELRLHGLLHHRAAGRHRQPEGTADGSGSVGDLGYLRRHLLRAQLEEERQGDHSGHQARLRNPEFCSDQGASRQTGLAPCRFDGPARASSVNLNFVASLL